MPIVAVEAGQIAARFPLVWRRSGEGLELGALMFLAEHGDGAARYDLMLNSIKPLLLEAYPLAPGAEDGGVSEVFIDAVDLSGEDTLAAFASDATPSAALARSLSILQVFSADRARTARFNDVLEQSGLVEDWEVRLQIADRTVGLDGLCILARDWRSRPEVLHCIEEHGAALAELIVLHELSLFNMQRLVEYFHSEIKIMTAQG